MMYAIWKRFDEETRRRVLAAEDWDALKRRHGRSVKMCPLGYAINYESRPKKKWPNACDVADALTPPGAYLGDPEWDAVHGEAWEFMVAFGTRGHGTGDMASALGVER